MNITKSNKPIIISLAIILAVIGVFVVSRILKPENNLNSTISTGVAQPAVGKQAPDFSVKTIDGKEFSLADHKGKPVILFAMFGGCGECIPVGQTLNQIQKDYASKGVAVVAIDILNGEPLNTLQQYRDYIKAEFQFVSYDEAVVGAYKLTAPEITYVIDKNGNIAYINQKALNYEQYKEQLEKSL